VRQALELVEDCCERPLPYVDAFRVDFGCCAVHGAACVCGSTSPVATAALLTLPGDPSSSDVLNH
jgi:hypothetical protein